jgi:hypothetical protein
MYSVESCGTAVLNEGDIFRSIVCVCPYACTRSGEILYGSAKSQLSISALTLKELNSVARVRERIIPTERSPLVGEVLLTSVDRGCHVVSVTYPYGSILGFLDRSRYLFFQVSPQFY